MWCSRSTCGDVFLKIALGFDPGLPLPLLPHQPGRGVGITAAFGGFLFVSLKKKRKKKFLPLQPVFSSSCMAFRKSFDKDSPGSWMINIIFLTCLALSATCDCSLPHVGSSSLTSPGAALFAFTLGVSCLLSGLSLALPLRPGPAAPAWPASPARSRQPPC